MRCTQSDGASGDSVVSERVMPGIWGNRTRCIDNKERLRCCIPDNNDTKCSRLYIASLDGSNSGLLPVFWHFLGMRGDFDLFFAERMRCDCSGIVSVRS